tara:strand:+ start:341 stop:601 length:261 start_codon:yes stop_codon:yes gene_type:complete
MNIEKLMKITEALLDKDIELTEADDVMAKEKALSFERVLNENKNFIDDVCGGNMIDATPEIKGAIFNVLCDLNEILYVQDQLEMPN